jgi:hypothetical protein
MKIKPSGLLIALALLCVTLFIKPYILVAPPEDAILIVYPPYYPEVSLYILKNGAIEYVAGERRRIEVEGISPSGTYRMATEEEGSWKKVEKRKRGKMDDEKYQKLLVLATELHRRQVKVPIAFSTIHIPRIFISYRGQEYGMFITDGADLDIGNSSAISSADENTLLRSIIKIVFEASPIPIEPLPPPQ